MVQPRIAVVGASLGGLRTVEGLRSLGVTGPITVIGEEAQMPYNRPPLSKEFLSCTPEDQVSSADGLYFKVRPNLGETTWRLGMRATATSLANRTLSLQDGSEIRFDALVVASGLRPKRIAATGGEEHRLVCRRIGDAIAIRDRVRRGTKVIIAGAGFIGCELASTLTALGAKVTIVEQYGLPMERSLGKQLATAFHDLHVSRGVTFKLGQTIVDFVCTPFGSLDFVQLDNGARLPADLVVEAVGSIANVEWLAGNSLDLSDGVLCDRAMQVEGHAGVVAVGDIARFPNDFVGPSPRRIEHWCIPGQTAKRAAETLAIWAGMKMQRDESFAPLPSFWSDQYGIRIQAYGTPIGVDRWHMLEGEISAAGLVKGVAIAGSRGKYLSYVVSAGLPSAKSMTYRSLLLECSMKH